MPVLERSEERHILTFSFKKEELIPRILHFFPCYKDRNHEDFKLTDYSESFTFHIDTSSCFLERPFFPRSINGWKIYNEKWFNLREENGEQVISCTIEADLDYEEWTVDQLRRFLERGR